MRICHGIPLTSSSCVCQAVAQYLSRSIRIWPGWWLRGAGGAWAVLGRDCSAGTQT